MIGETEVSQRNGAPPKLAGTFPLAILLSCAGGYLDAFTWVGQGGVFANAQTGNVVLLGINVATGQWSEALRHLMPIIAFVVGVFAAFWIRSLASARGEPWINLISLLLELAVLIVVAFLPTGSSSMPIVLASPLWPPSKVRSSQNLISGRTIRLSPPETFGGRRSPYSGVLVATVIRVI